MYAKIENGAVVEWPIPSITKLFPNTSFPSPLTAESMPEGYVIVGVIPPPQVGASQKAVPSGPIYQNNQWVQGWDVVAMDEAEIAEAADALIQTVIGQTQNRLDEFAKTRGYDGILSACTYASSSVPAFAAEGQYCVQQRDATWTTLLGILNDVKDGLRPVPSGYAAVESELPVLAWP